MFKIAAKAGAKAGASLAKEEAKKSGAQAGAVAGAEAGVEAGAEAGAKAATLAATEVATKTLMDALKNLEKFKKPVGVVCGICDRRCYQPSINNLYKCYYKCFYLILPNRKLTSLRLFLFLSSGRGDGFQPLSDFATIMSMTMRLSHFPKTIKEWNTLPLALVESDSVLSFP